MAFVMNNAENIEQKCLIETVGIDKSYTTKRETIHVLSDTHLKIFSGEVLGIVGASGVGKSTLLHVLGGLDKPLTGNVLFQGKDIYKQPNGYLENFRNAHIGFVFQFHHLLPEFTALENALLPALVAGVDLRKEASELLASVGLAGRLHHRPGELSGGECQRVAMVRALVVRPLVVLADEPSGNLDEATSESLHELLTGLAREHGQAFVVMTHDRRLAQSMDRTGRIEAGVLKMEDNAT